MNTATLAVHRSLKGAQLNALSPLRYLLRGSWFALCYNIVSPYFVRRYCTPLFHPRPFLVLGFYKLPQHERFKLVVKNGEYACPDGNTRRSLRFEEVRIQTRKRFFFDAYPARFDYALRSMYPDPGRMSTRQSLAEELGSRGRRKHPGKV